MTRHSFFWIACSINNCGNKRSYLYLGAKRAFKIGPIYTRFSVDVAYDICLVLSLYGVFKGLLEFIKELVGGSSSPICRTRGNIRLYSASGMGGQGSTRRR